jgi:glucose/arabinose dehydrogenase
MGAVEHNDIQVREAGENAIRELIRELNRQLRYVAQTVTNNFRSPVSIPTKLSQDSTVWVPVEMFDVLSFDFYCKSSGFTINAISDSGSAITMDPALPAVVVADTHTHLDCATAHRVASGSDIFIGFSTPPTTDDVAVSINVRRLG